MDYWNRCWSGSTGETEAASSRRPFESGVPRQAGGTTNPPAPARGPVAAAPDDVDVPPEASTVARRYRRVERLVSGAVALLVAAVAVAAFLRLPVLQALAVWVVVLAVVRVPAFRSTGAARLVTDADPEEVRADLEGATPPVLAFQWGIADDVRRTGDGGAYEISYLFGLRSTSVATEVRSRPSDDGGPVGELDLVVTAGGKPWGTYSVAIDRRDGRTVIDVEVASDRRFGLRRLPQLLVAERYREEALGVQGYAVVERDVSLSL